MDETQQVQSTLNKINSAQEPQTSDYVYAGFWIRFLALFIDGLLFYAVIFALEFVSISTGISAILYLSYIIGIVYYIYFEGTIGATLGKQAVGIKVINEKGGIIGPVNATLRYIGKMISGLILCIGYLMVSFDFKKRGLHDRIASTYVVYKK